MSEPPAVRSTTDSVALLDDVPPISADADYDVLVACPAHSLRAGFVTYAHLRGASDGANIHQTRHRSLATLGGFVPIQQAWTDNAATALVLKHEHPHSDGMTDQPPQHPAVGIRERVKAPLLPQGST